LREVDELWDEFHNEFKLLKSSGTSRTSRKMKLP
jgi:hypothetical protein